MERENKKFKEISEEEKERKSKEEYEKELMERIEFENAFNEILREFYYGEEESEEKSL